jgi:hypothetical protein
MSGSGTRFSKTFHIQWLDWKHLVKTALLNHLAFPIVFRVIRTESGYCLLESHEFMMHVLVSICDVRAAASLVPN